MSSEATDRSSSGLGCAAGQSRQLHACVLLQSERWLSAGVIIAIERFDLFLSYDFYIRDLHDYLGVAFGVVVSALMGRRRLRKRREGEGKRRREEEGKGEEGTGEIEGGGRGRKERRKERERGKKGKE